jgi:hypothetical protein
VGADLQATEAFPTSVQGDKLAQGIPRIGQKGVGYQTRCRELALATLVAVRIKFLFYDVGEQAQGDWMCLLQK